MSRNYRELAAQRLADIAALKLELLAKAEEIADLKDEISGTSTAGIQLEAKNLALSAAFKDLEDELNDEKLGNQLLTERLEEVKGALKAHTSLLTRIYYYIVDHPPKGDMVAEHRFRAVVEAIEELKGTDYGKEG